LRRYTAFLFLLYWLVAAGANAQPQALREPQIAPVPAWVVPTPLPAPDPSKADRPLQTLLVDNQSRYAGDHSDHYLRMAALVQNVQGLQMAGNLILPWPEDHADLIIHEVLIIRGNEVIDLLARGQRFAVLRRENNLEASMLDGTLTAAMQPEGLAVGDVLSFSFTMRRRGTTLPHRAENLISLPSGQTIRRLNVRQLWPASLPIRWRATGAYEGAVARTTPAGTEVAVSLNDATAPEMPAMLPSRFATASALEVSQYRDWAELSAMLAPHYERARQLAPDSPIRAEVQRIASLSTDPRVRTMAALRLVQDQVRYFALVMGDGNYLPASADQTWARRFADCKGKTVLLVALLRELGIQAEPVLVHSGAGDSIAGRLPMPQLFNHMIVRARIDGRSYWLDGTSAGDRNLDDLASATFIQGLPVTAEGAALEAIPYSPPAQPLFETNIIYDGSRGLGGRVPVRIEMVARREQAVQWRQLVSLAGRDEFLRRLREESSQVRGNDVEITNAEIRDDPEAGTMTTIISARASMPWDRVSGTPARRFKFDDETISWDTDFEREAGPFRDAPFEFPVPVYLASTETLILPNRGRGFTLDGSSFTKDVAGVRISRQLSIANGSAVARSEFRRLQREVPAAAARAAAADIAAIREDSAYVRAASLAALGGTGGQAGRVRSGTEAPTAGVAAAEPTTAEGLVQRGFERLRARQYDEADADFVRAAELDPNWSRPVANRAVVMLNRGRIDEAEPLIERARSLDPNDFVVHQAQGALHLARGRPIQAVVAYSRAIELDPRNTYNLSQRAYAFTQLAAFDDSLADLDALLAIEPRNVAALMAKAQIHAWRGNAEPAIAAADAALAITPENPGLISSRADTLRNLGRAADAEAGYRAALAAVAALEGVPADVASRFRSSIYSDMGDAVRAVAEIDPLLARNPRDAELLNARCWTLATANVQLERALADCDRAVAAAPTNAAILDSRAFVRLRLGQLDGALADADAAIAIAPRLPAALYVRGIVRLRRGEREAGERDLAAARRLSFDIDSTYRRYGVTP
jgi:tetratricopeptide (TPR) repeat protein